MYLEHFEFARHPFRMAPEEDFLYMSRQHSRAFVFMDSAIWSPEGFVVISGEIGSGKTTLLKKMISDVKEDVMLFHIAYTNLQGDDLFQIIMQQANIKVAESNKVTMLFAINEHLRKLADRGMPVLLAIDEAQNLSHENLEDIRMLAGMEGPNGPIMRVILLGQPELKDHITVIPQLTQRVKLFFHLEGLSFEDTRHYIHHRLTVAGAPTTLLFHDSILHLVHEYSNGIPRLINKICDGLLLCAFAEDRHELVDSDIDEIKSELHVASTDDKAEKAAEEAQSALDVVSQAPAAANSDYLSVLERIAASLESLDNKIGALSTPDKNSKIRLFDEARRRLKDGK